MSKTIVIIPTYNEKDNLPIITKKIFDLNIKGLEILIVDDNSPDGTGQLADELATKHPLRVIHRDKKNGIGSAYIEGFKKALELGADYIFEMDADLSHDPEHIIDFLTAINNYDLVLGSRYIKEGGTIGWGIIRQLISRGGNVYARSILKMPLKDLTGGFKCFRRRVLETIDLDKINSDGYSFQIELTYRSWQKRFKIKEIPIIFKDRSEGKSKMSHKIILEALWRVWQMKIQKL